MESNRPLADRADLGRRDPREGDDASESDVLLLDRRERGPDDPADGRDLRDVDAPLGTPTPTRDAGETRTDAAVGDGRSPLDDPCAQPQTSRHAVGGGLRRGNRHRVSPALPRDAHRPCGLRVGGLTEKAAAEIGNARRRAGRPGPAPNVRARPEEGAVGPKDGPRPETRVADGTRGGGGGVAAGGGRLWRSGLGARAGGADTERAPGPLGAATAGSDSPAPADLASFEGGTETGGKCDRRPQLFAVSGF